MAALLRQLQNRVATVTELVAKNNKQLLENNKQFIVEKPTIEKCQELSKQLFYTRLASLPGRYKAIWQELDHLKSKLYKRDDLELEDVGMGLLFVVEYYAWFCMGEIIGCGGTVTGYKYNMSVVQRHSSHHSLYGRYPFEKLVCVKPNKV